MCVCVCCGDVIRRKALVACSLACSVVHFFICALLVLPFINLFLFYLATVTITPHHKSLSPVPFRSTIYSSTHPANRRYLSIVHSAFDLIEKREGDFEILNFHVVRNSCLYLGEGSFAIQRDSGWSPLVAFLFALWFCVYDVADDDMARFPT